MSGYIRVCVIRQAVYPSATPPLLREVAALKEAGYKPYLITQRGHLGSTLPFHEVRDGVHIYRVLGGRKKGSKTRYIYEYSFFFIQTFFLLIWLHLRYRFRVIQVNTMPDFLVFATVIPRLLGAKIIIMMKEPMPELWQTIYDRPPPRWLIRIEQAAIAYADVAFTVTEELKAAFVGRGADADKIHVILNTPDKRFWLGIADTMPLPGHRNSTFTLMCHGTVENRYGHDLILQAVDQVKDHIPNLRLRITGHGSRTPHLEQQIKDMGLSQWVEFLGWVPYEQLVWELLAADVGVVGLRSSPYSNLIHTNKMYEYILFNKPVILSRLRAVNNLWDDDALCYFEPGNVDDLAKCIQILHDQPQKRRELARRASRLLDEKYSWALQKAHYLSVYKTLIQ